MMQKPDETTVPGDSQKTDETTVKVAAAAVANDFDDEELTLPESTESLNRMGMDTIACVGCQ